MLMEHSEGPNMRKRELETEQDKSLEFQFFEIKREYTVTSSKLVSNIF